MTDIKCSHHLQLKPVKVETSLTSQDRTENNFEKDTNSRMSLVK